MIIELIAFGLILTACLAIQLDEAVYAVFSLACFFLCTVLLYAFNGADFAAIFTFAMGAGTISLLLLAGGILSDKPEGSKPLRSLLTAVLAAVVLTVPAILLSAGIIIPRFSFNLPFEHTLWGLRAMDILLQGLVMLSVAIGIAIILHEKHGGEKA